MAGRAISVLSNTMPLPELFSPLPAFPAEAPDKLASLRALLAGKFPTLAPKPGGILRTGLASLDAAEGGLRRAALTEFSATSGAGALFIHAMLRALERERCFAALVDAARSFEPEGAAPETLARLLLVFCAEAMPAVKAADLLLRDGNLTLVMLDFQMVPARELQRIPSTTWHRLQRLAEQTAAAVVVLTPQPLVEAAQVRITATPNWTLTAQHQWQRELLTAATWQLFPRRARERENAATATATAGTA